LNVVLSPTEKAIVGRFQLNPLICPENGGAEKEGLEKAAKKRHMMHRDQTTA
jgi:hypothetical protein